MLAGEDAVKAGGEKYLPRLDSQSDEEFKDYLNRASFFNATGRTAEAHMVFRRPPFLKLPTMAMGVGRSASIAAMEKQFIIAACRTCNHENANTGQ